APGHATARPVYVFPHIPSKPAAGPPPPPPDANLAIALTVVGAQRDGETVVVVEARVPPDAARFRARRTRWLRYAEFGCREAGGSLSSILDSQHTRHSVSLPAVSEG
ncbi:MAG: hypothetical protein ACT4OZ_10590, partial [Gemmatimonadota bacterium]